MRLTIKLLTWFFVCVLFAVGLNGLYGVRTELARYELDLGERHVVMGRVLRAAFSAVMETEGETHAVSVLDYTDRRFRRVDIRWVYLDHAPPEARRPHVALEALAPLRSDQEVHERLNGSLYTYVPMRLEGRPVSALEFTEKLDGESAVVRSALFGQLRIVGATALGIGIVASIVGLLVVARPIRRLVEHARRIGRGDLSAAPIEAGRDEIAQLGREMNAMCEKLAEAQDAKLRALEQLRHGERLSTVGLLASGLAHELGTPLNVISLRAKAIARGRSTGSQAQEAATSIEQQASRVTQLVRQLLDFARRKTPDRAVVTIASVAERASDLVGTVATGRQVRIEVDVPPSLTVLGDAVQLEQVLTNIVLNAVQVVGAGGRVRIGGDSVEATPPVYLGGNARAHVRVTVMDDGPGIAPDVLPHVFEPFFTTKDVGEGTGLGLAVCYGIVRDHGGWIDVESAPGRGTKVMVYVPSDGAAS
ncbi:MAG: HAMP domain-containing sensor histidine kinase [Labilithrix sp.]